jgi:NAD-dependent dihydropyrimidine dehydrogenase PreA subunit
MFFNRKRTRTPFVQLDTQKCKACWKCVDNCSNQVISKINLPFHKHARVDAAEKCTGCLKCIDVCENGACIKVDKTKPVNGKQRKRTFNNFLINNLLLVSVLAMIYSGLVLQLGFHMGGHDRHQNASYEVRSLPVQYEQLREIDTSKIVNGFTYSVWSAIHKFVIVFFSLLMIYHTYVHWKWYKGVITKHFIGKNRQVIILSVLFLLVAVTGLVPWFIDLSGGTSVIRMLFIEIHDKLTFVLIVFLFLHFVKRAKWYASAYAKLKLGK